MIKESFESTCGLLTAGIITVNKSNVAQFESILSQGRETSPVEINKIAREIELTGFQFCKPITLNLEGRTIDGYTRGKAIVMLINEGCLNEIDIPFIQAEGTHDMFNNTRGISSSDLSGYFKPRGVVSGVAERAVEQAVEACKMLDVTNTSYAKAFDPNRTQAHYAKIDTYNIEFTDAFNCVINMLEGSSPDHIKFSHWIAFFVRYGVSRLTINIAKNHVLTNTGTNQLERYAIFNILEKKFSRSRVL